MAERLTPRHRRAALVWLAAFVLAMHAWLADGIAARLADFGAAAAMPPRIEVAYVRELELAAPPAVAPVVVPVPSPPRRVSKPVPAASAPADVAERVAQAPVAEAAVPETPVPEPPPPEAAPEPAPEPPAAAASAEAASAVATAASAPSAAASAAPAFDWPPSTRLSYKLSGNVRGEVHGDAQVEWVRAGTRYQVHLDVTVGLPIAPLMTRRMSSDGELGAEGLAPQRYDEDTKVAFRPRRRLTMVFGPDVVLLPDGRRMPRWPGVQDTASQFVQLSWLFTLQPERLRVGQTVELALALPRSVDRWVYDVLAQEPVYTAFGAVEAFHLKPRRLTRPGGELRAEIWFAPQLRYLPVRIRIEQDAQTYVDLVLARRPEIAGP
jgi:hypothetical protein